MMDEFELREKIAKGENLHTEFKELIESNEDLAKSIVCFANTDGGQIILGISKTGEIVGVENVDETIRRIDDVAFNRCEPPVTAVVETIPVEDKTVVVVNVPKGEQRPYRTQSGFYYIRSANRCRQASRQELLRLFQATETIFYDETEIQKAQIYDLDIEEFVNFTRRYMGVSISEDSEEVQYLMKNLKVISRKGKPTLAGILFFGRNPQQYLPYAKIICAYIEGKDISGTPTDIKSLQGKISSILEDTIKFLKIYLREEHRIKGFEPEIYSEIPEEALREAIINAIAHRDYTISAPIRILIFKDRIEIHSPGRLPNTVTIESMKVGGAHVLRNPTIYNFFAKMGLVTDIGSGVKRIIESVKKTLQEEVQLMETENEFILKVPRKISMAEDSRG
ncbi:putative DNA binding domain-containing protein [Dehalococcoidia bacterium]|nr:putative DNA binding domain-containing protein [Dehalococcoidia bacterium]MCL0065055.1 putative DNA binding domain-containing protein [Dehalococcoidia bacterium]